MLQQNLNRGQRPSILLISLSLILFFLIGCAKKVEVQTEQPPASNYIVLMKEKESGKYGYMDNKGNTVVQPIYFEAGKFSSGRGRVRRNQSDPFVYIDATGKIAIQSEFLDARDFSEGYAAVKFGELWGYIDTTGKVIIPPKFQLATEFDHGRAKVQVKKDFNGKEMVTTIEIDTNGNEVE